MYQAPHLHKLLQHLRDQLLLVLELLHVLDFFLLELQVPIDQLVAVHALARLALYLREMQHDQAL